jgi:hypothetical protein
MVLRQKDESRGAEYKGAEYIGAEFWWKVNVPTLNMQNGKDVDVIKCRTVKLSMFKMSTCQNVEHQNSSIVICPD